MEHRGVGVNVAGRQLGTEHLLVAGPVAKHEPVTELAKEWNGYGTALKPAYEPIILARKPLTGTMAQNVDVYGVGGLNIDGTRIGASGGTTKAALTSGSDSVNTLGSGLNGSYGIPIDGGRWSANVVFSHAEGCTFRETVEVWQCEAGCPVAILDAQTGGASRFFYCAKVNKKERNRGCEQLPLRSAGEVTDREEGSAGLNSPRAGPMAITTIIRHSSRLNS